MINNIFFNLTNIFSVIQTELTLTTTDKILLEKRKRRTSAIPYIQKKMYLKSEEWHVMQRLWLDDSGYRCQMFPFIILGKHSIRNPWNKKKIRYYGRYAVHHINQKSYKRIGQENLNEDVIVLSKFAHNYIYHYLLSFGKQKVGEQKVLRFPNFLQRLLNLWCVLNHKIKFILFIIFSWTVFL